MTASGSQDVAIVLRSGADNEMTSGLVARRSARSSAMRPASRAARTGPLASAELFVIINLPKRSTGTDANVPLRGVEAPRASTCAATSRSSRAASSRPGKNEVIVGAGAAREFAGLDRRRHEIRIGQNDWDVVGIFTAGGGVGESEIWTDADVLQPAYNRGIPSSPSMRGSTSPASFQQFKDALTTNPQLKVKVVALDEFYRRAIHDGHASSSPPSASSSPR